MFHIRLQKSQSTHNSGIFSSPCGDFTGGEGSYTIQIPTFDMKMLYLTIKIVLQETL